MRFLISVMHNNEIVNIKIHNIEIVNINDLMKDNMNDM